MFEYASRYYNLETAQFTTPEGRVVAYKRRRFLPLNAGQTAIAEVKVTEGDRLDFLTAKVLGDPEQFWQLCDMNHAMSPADLIHPIGRTLQVVLPQPQIPQQTLPPGTLPGV
ncbi:MAG: hypothetical protein WCD18_14095 [Thermosynechococcaceae cyanobacterium]